MRIEVKLKGLPNEDLVQGFPGIPATWPRISGIVELRTVDPHKQTHEREPVVISAVHVGLFRTDTIFVPSYRPAISAPKREQSFLVTRQKPIYKGNPTKCYALDIPFTLSLPTNRPPTATISLPKMLESVYTAFVVVETYNSVSQDTSSLTYRFPLRIKKFDTLSTFGVYRQPLIGDVTSSDHLVSLEYKLPVRAYGPGDTIKVSLRAVPNQDWPKAKKVKLKRISVELIQVTKFFVEKNKDSHFSLGNDSNDSISSKSAPHSRSHSFYNSNSQVSTDMESINGDNSTIRISDTASNASTTGSAAPNAEIETMETTIRIAKNDRNFSNAEQDKREGIMNDVILGLLIPSAFTLNTNSVLNKEPPEVGYDGKVPFTNSCALYSIEFKLIFKARFSHARDVQTSDTITLSQFDDSSRIIYMKSLMAHAKKVKHMDRRPPVPRVYLKPLDRQVSIL
ncbi:hypothetical protein DASB73_007820 [Starmerella bacillaris]|uniref:Arrestin C-terminal-like domain-containing protein n=1 Tax=Starmerella bacillaris TaxID=1247836 RepID=A0AAV5RE36_STABA|nr:hypothetical protein DASB73_007820 [Starmerella bacillaris]